MNDIVNNKLPVDIELSNGDSIEVTEEMAKNILESCKDLEDKAAFFADIAKDKSTFETAAKKVK
jgi:hypothetical protein